jgi:peptidoglycan-associated lipoprotein
MNVSKFSTLLVLGVAVSLAGTGCKKKDTGVTHLPDGSGMTGPGNGPGSSGTLDTGGGLTPVPMGGGDTAPFDPDQMAQDRTAFATDIVYFDYDSSTIKGSEQSKLSAVASALKSDSSAKLLVEGNCDERGTEEYNRSLGERRALAARETLANEGVDASRIATRSYGEDKPADPSHTQSAWAKNRRDEFVLLHPR